MKSEDTGILIGIMFMLAMGCLIQIGTFIKGDSDDMHIKHIVQALEVCEDNDGLRMIDGNAFSPHRFLCYNGAVFAYDMRAEPQAAIEIVAYESIVVDLDAGMPDYCRRSYTLPRTEKEVDQCLAHLKVFFELSLDKSQ